MAYITTEQVKEKRVLLKKAFPAKHGWRFSVTREHMSSINISIMQYPDNYDFNTPHNCVNHFYIKDSDFGENEKEVLLKINEIAHLGHWDDSDMMTDYFNCAFYVNLSIGKWDKPAVSVHSKVKLPTETDKLNNFYLNLVKTGDDVADVLQMMYS